MNFARYCFGIALSFVIGLSHSFAGTFDSNTQVKTWNGLLSKYVKKNGGVDYIGFKKDQAKLESFISAYKNFDPKSHSDISKTAHYINLYNATMIFNILRHAKEEKIDLNSKKFLKLKINDIKVEGGNIWNGNYKVSLGQISVNLDNIEHDLIRGKGKGDLEKFKVKTLDPRIHAAVNCAAMSCPRVREIAYSENNVAQLLEENIKNYVSNNDQFKKLSSSKMRANSIVFWYYADFDDYAQDSLKLNGAGDYLSQFIENTKDKDWKIKHLKENFNDRSRFSLKLSSSFDFYYDWTINDIRNRI
jgi:hypothetical protein